MTLGQETCIASGVFVGTTFVGDSVGCNVAVIIGVLVCLETGVDVGKDATGVQLTKRVTERIKKKALFVSIIFTTNYLWDRTAERLALPAGGRDEITPL